MPLWGADDAGKKGSGEWRDEIIKPNDYTVSIVVVRTTVSTVCRGVHLYYNVGRRVLVQLCSRTFTYIFSQFRTSRARNNVGFVEHCDLGTLDDDPNVKWKLEATSICRLHKKLGSILNPCCFVNMSVCPQWPLLSSLIGRGLPLQLDVSLGHRLLNAMAV